MGVAYEVVARVGHELGMHHPDLALGQSSQTGRIPRDGAHVVGYRGERASHAYGPRADADLEERGRLARRRQAWRGQKQGGQEGLHQRITAAFLVALISAWPALCAVTE